MKWNWQQPDWPNFTFEVSQLVELEQTFMHNSGLIYGAYKHLGLEDKDSLRVSLISNEAHKTSEIEGQYLDRDSLQSSICKQFGLKSDGRRVKPAERGISELMVALYKTYDRELSHEMLFTWHKSLMLGRDDLDIVGSYRTSKDPMQIISGPFHEPSIHFEAVPSSQLGGEMDMFIQWFNKTSLALSPVIRASICHLYFESIHPFEDGNGRVGRALSEKILAQSIKRPALIALSTVIHKNKKAYYQALENANKKNDITEWILYFASVILDAMHYTHSYVEFLIEKTKLFDQLGSQLNERQEKCMLRLFQEGPDGFEGGLSADNYMRITKATRPTTTRDLADLVSKGALNRVGEKRATRYYLNYPRSQVLNHRFQLLK